MMTFTLNFTYLRLESSFFVNFSYIGDVAAREIFTQTFSEQRARVSCYRTNEQAQKPVEQTQGFVLL